MLNQERIALYTAALKRKTADGAYRLTPRQRRRVHKKQHAHAHFANGSCDRCRPGRIRDAKMTTAAAGPVTKWERT